MASPSPVSVPASAPMAAPAAPERRHGAETPWAAMLPAAAGWPWAARLLLRLAVALALRGEARRRRPRDITRLSPHLRRDVGLES